MTSYPNSGNLFRNKNRKTTKHPEYSGDAEIDGVPQAVTDTTTAIAINWGTRVIELLNERSLNLETFQGVEEATVDLYGAVRNGYLQKRAKAIRE